MHLLFAGFIFIMTLDPGVSYPSGQVAVMVSSTVLGQYNYVIMDDSEDQHILAIFDPHGFGTVYFLNGNIKSVSPLDGFVPVRMCVCVRVCVLFFVVYFSIDMCGNAF
jgi:hypothetical protein